jgi:hypothetical protein
VALEGQVSAVSAVSAVGVGRVAGSRGITAQLVECRPLVAAFSTTDPVVLVDLNDLTTMAMDSANFVIIYILASQFLWRVIGWSISGSH